MDDSGKRAVFLSLIIKGTPEQPRWMIADQCGRVWNQAAATFVPDPKLGTLYADHREAAWDIHDMLVAEYQEMPTYDFEAPLRIRIYSAAPLDETVVAAWCQKACRMLLDAAGCGLGPLDGTFGLVVANWLELKKRTDPGGAA